MELSLTHSEHYEEMGIKPFSMVCQEWIKCCWPKQERNQTPATFLGMVGMTYSEVPRQWSKLIGELFQVGKEHPPFIVFIDGIDTIGNKR